jgi:TolB-like protein
MKNSAYVAVNCSPAECVRIHGLPDPVPETLCRMHLAKIAGSVTVGRAEQLRHLLPWLGERSLAEHPSPPSEKEIAVAVLHRKDFDPQTDSVVRKEMSRLREKLARYYTSEGLHDEVRIVANSGYLVAFEPRSTVNLDNGRSCWLILPFRSNVEATEQGEQLLEDLLVALGERNGPELVACTTALAYRGRVGDVRQFASECRADFVVEGSLRCLKETMEATVWFVDGRSGRARGSRRISGAGAFDVARLAAAWLLEQRSLE